MGTIFLVTVSKQYSTTMIYIALTFYIVKLINRLFKVYEKIRVGYMQLLHHFMQGTWANKEFGVRNQSPMDIELTGYIDMLYIDLYGNACIYTWLPNKRYHFTQYCMPLFVESFSIDRTRADQRNDSIQINFGESMSLGGYLLRYGWGTTLRNMADSDSCFAKNPYPSMGDYSQKTCITRVPWATCTFLYHWRTVPSPPIVYCVYNLLPSFLILTGGSRILKKINK